MPSLSKKDRANLAHNVLQYAEKNSEDIYYDMKYIEGILCATLGYSPYSVRQQVKLFVDMGCIKIHREEQDEIGIIFEYPVATISGMHLLREGMDIQKFEEARRASRKVK